MEGFPKAGSISHSLNFPLTLTHPKDFHFWVVLSAVAAFLPDLPWTQQSHENMESHGWSDWQRCPKEFGGLLALPELEPVLPLEARVS